MTSGRKAYAPSTARCSFCGRLIEPCKGLHGGGFMHSDDHRELGDDGHRATLAFLPLEAS